MLKKKKVEDRLVVYLEGRLDVTVATEVEEQLIKLIDDEGEKHIILNLEQVEYMSSSGFRACIAILRKLKQRDGSLKLCNIRPSVKRIFDVIELTSLFDIFDSEDAALQS
ncbi:MAG: STAS domain-containing protein [Leptonema illini]|uniref:Anti-sigma factor antagonist n=2 Tax=Leptonema illini TaxID=183 RepID=H2CD90_9LEPT|nr:STAS domain-containing protein [Leptonema illini]EHQ05394.1 anti-sigma-factor antagonist [Leptonema illini DSM 21528]KAB2929489.1 MAG: STAS domain-containing protein [Leptonema illini]PKL32400.1 MAG: anti-sigma factor antagonist [Spirochaetae bacterium HGW-Spirochaetae-10]